MFRIDKRKGLELVFSPDKCALEFASENIQELIFNNIAIEDVKHFSCLTDINDTNLTSSDNLIGQYRKFYQLVKESDFDLRFPETMSVLKNDVKLHFDFNLSAIYAKDIRTLFNFSSFIFNAFNFNFNICTQIITNNPGRIIKLNEINGVLLCKTNL